MRSTFKLLFYINRQKIKKNGKCPIMGRITLDGKVCQYSTGEEVLPECWDAGKGRAVILGQCPEINRGLKGINLKLEEFEEKARLAYKKSVDGIGYVSAELIKNAVTGKAQPKNTLLTLFDEHNMEYESVSALTERAIPISVILQPAGICTISFNTNMVWKTLPSVQLTCSSSRISTSTCPPYSV